MSRRSAPALHDDRRSVIAVCLMLFVVAWGTNVATPFLVLYGDRLELSDSQTVTIFTVYVLGILATLVVAGPLSDRVGRRRVVLPAAAASAVASLILIAGQDSYLLLLFGRMLLGMVSGACFGVGAAWLQELFGPDRSTTAALTTTLITYGGFGIGPPISAVFALFQDNPLVAPFILHAVLMVLAVVFAMGARETLESPDLSGPLFRLGIPPQARRHFWTRIAPVSVWVFAFPSTAFALFPVLISNQIPGRDVTIAALSGMFTAWAALAARPVLQRFGPGRAVAVGLGTGLCGYVLGAIAVGTSWWFTVLPGSVCLGAASGIITASVLTTLASMSEPDGRGALNSSFYVLAYIGMGMPTLVTLLGGAIGTGAALATISVATGLVLLSTLRWPTAPA